MSLWDIAIEEAKFKKENKESDFSESTILFIGSKSSGKTSLINRFLEKEETPKPTVALEYLFGRRARGHNLAKDVTHIYELGGGTWLTKLIDIAVNADTIAQLSVVLVIDLSQPNEIWKTIETLLNAVRQRIENVLERISNQDASIREQLKARIEKNIGDHIDRKMMNPFPVPLLIIGGKFDLFKQEIVPEKQKIITKTLRFLAHNYGASLQFFSVRNDQSQGRVRSLLSHYAFGTQENKTMQFDHNNPLMVPTGSDSFQNIGGPAVSDDDFNRLTARNPVDLWKHAFLNHFPPEKQSRLPSENNPADDPQYSEPMVDAERVKMNEELEKYRKLSDRKMRDLMQQAINEGLVVI